MLTLQCHVIYGKLWIQTLNARNGLLRTLWMASNCVTCGSDFKQVRSRKQTINDMQILWTRHDATVRNSPQSERTGDEFHGLDQWTLAQCRNCGMVFVGTLCVCAFSRRLRSFVNSTTSRCNLIGSSATSQQLTTHALTLARRLMGRHVVSLSAVTLPVGFSFGRDGGRKQRNEN